MNFCFKYNENVTDSSLVDKKYKNKRKYQPTYINSLEFINKHSVQNDSLYFTNKLQRSSGNRINMLKKITNDLVLFPDKLDDYFNGEEISMLTKADVNKLKRLDGILKLHNNIPSEEKIIKYAPNKRFYDEYNQGDYERGFQLFYTRNSNNDVKVYLIDLYHLAIPSRGNQPKQEYSIREKYKKDLFDCVFTENKDTSRQV